MDPKFLISPSSPLGLPASFWFIELFKVLGFTLHMVPMHLWYAGLILALFLRSKGSENGKCLGARLMNAMPILVAAGVNFGIVPLLFTQVAYYKVFYASTILMAWPWFSIIPMLTIAYYGVYIYATALRKDSDRIPPISQAVGWVSGFIFLAIGFLFSNQFSLMVRINAWPGLWQKTSLAGAPLGIALNLSDPSLWPRWLLMFGLALTTTAAYIVWDTAFFASKESDAYKCWAIRFAQRVYSFGILWFAVFGSWYVFGSWTEDLRREMFSIPLVYQTALTAIVPALPWLLITAQRRRITPMLALLTGLAQFGVLALNAVSRQTVQNAELRPYLNPSAEAVKTQWGPLILFLVLFAAGIAVVCWMVGKALEASRKPAMAG